MNVIQLLLLERRLNMNNYDDAAKCVAAAVALTKSLEVASVSEEDRMEMEQHINDLLEHALKLM